MCPTEEEDDIWEKKDFLGSFCAFFVVGVAVFRPLPDNVAVVDEGVRELTSYCEEVEEGNWCCGLGFYCLNWSSYRRDFVEKGNCSSCSY